MIQAVTLTHEYSLSIYGTCYLVTGAMKCCVSQLPCTWPSQCLVLIHRCLSTRSSAGFWYAWPACRAFDICHSGRWVQGWPPGTSFPIICVNWFLWSAVPNMLQYAPSLDIMMWCGYGRKERCLTKWQEEWEKMTAFQQGQWRRTKQTFSFCKVVVQASGLVLGLRKWPNPILSEGRCVLY